MSSSSESGWPPSTEETTTMRTLFAATAVFAALVMVAPVGKAHAADDSAACYDGGAVLAAVYDFAAANVKGNNETDRRILVAEMAGRKVEVNSEIMDIGGQHMELGLRGRTPTVSCADTVRQAAIYTVGDPALFNAAMKDQVVDKVLCQWATRNHIPTGPGAVCE
jgi:hypothetical protein